MSIPDHELDESDDREGWCSIHEHFHSLDNTCSSCRDDEADRQHDSQREERGRA